MMVIKIPQSLFDAIQKLDGRPKPLGAHTVTVNGPYGKYEIQAVPDEAYCESVPTTVLRYKENTACPTTSETPTP